MTPQHLQEIRDRTTANLDRVGWVKLQVLDCVDLLVYVDELHVLVAEAKGETVKTDMLPAGENPPEPIDQRPDPPPPPPSPQYRK